MNVKQQGHTYFIHADDYSALNSESFDPNYWREQNAIVNEKKGRATAYFVKLSHSTIAVLRHYWRGGLIGKILSDQYLFIGLEKTRVYQEFSLLCALHSQGLAVPQPIAAQVKRTGLIYRGDILTKAIASAESLCERMQKQRISDSSWEAIARTIAKFHKAGVYHADLNINNILFSTNNCIYLIDFDRGELRTPALQWQKENMARLKRSFYKEAHRQETFYFSETNWQTLEQYYEDEMKKAVV
ncbi:3-deoxy-D-manno-octulosonic acid kinase [Pseudoalteromonas xiamenensis]